MSRTKTTARPIQQVLDRLENVRRSGGEWSALCPAHDDNNPSLSIKEGDDGRVLLKCHAGCGVEDIVTELDLDMEDLFSQPRTKKQGGAGTTLGLTLEAYAEAKRLPVDFLQELGVGQIYLQGMPVVRMPYLDHNGVVLSTRMRVSFEDGFRWKTGSKPTLYGLWRLRESKSKYVCVVEGESDCQTLWLHGFPVLGLPGADTWKEEWVEYFDAFQCIFVVIEPDRGGDAVQTWLQKSRIRDRVRLIKLDGAKDPSDLYLTDPGNFPQAWRAAMKNAVPWSELEDAERKARRKDAWARCKALARKEDILTLFVEDLRRRNVVGESRPAKLLYLGITSRFLERPVSEAIVATSAAGKSFVVERTLEYFPASAFYALTAMSEKALAYSTEPLSHRFLVLYEGAALNGEFQDYIVRSLLSEGRVKYVTVEKTPDGLQARVIEREGPTGLILTTTAVSLHPEDQTRYLTIPVSDSSAQTQRVLRALAKATNEESETDEVAASLEMWLALQEWLTFANHRVFIPCASALASLVPPVAVRLRRDFKSILHLIKAHAILHQKTRSRDESGRIVATIADYRAVWELVKDLVSEGVEQTVSKTTRATVAAVAEICKEKAGEKAGAVRRVNGEYDPVIAATVLEVAHALQLDRSSASRRLKQCLTCGYLKNLETKPRQPQRLVVGDPLPEECGVMPSPEELREKWKEMR